MFGADEVVAQQVCFLLGKHEDASGSVSEALEHTATLLPRVPPGTEPSGRGQLPGSGRRRRAGAWAMIGASRGRRRERTSVATSWRIVRGVGVRSTCGTGVVASPNARTKRLMSMGTSLTATGVLAAQTPCRHWLTTMIRFEACQATRRCRSPARGSSISTRGEVHPMGPVWTHALEPVDRLRSSLSGSG